MEKVNKMNKSRSGKTMPETEQSMKKTSFSNAGKSEKIFSIEGLADSSEKENQPYFPGSDIRNTDGNVLIEPGIILKVFQSAPEAMIIFDPEGVIYDCNPICLMLLGYDSSEELKGKNVIDLIVKNDHYKIKKGNRILTDFIGPEIECTLIHKSGSKIESEIAPSVLKDNKDNLLFFAVIIRDISYRKENENKIKGFIKFYEDILESIYIGVCVTDPNDNIIYVNKAIKDIFPVEPAYLYNKKFLALLEKRTNPKLKEYYESAKITLETKFLDSEPVTIEKGKSTYQSGWFIPKIKNKSFDGMICICHDVTSHKLSEDTLARERNLFSALIENIPFFVYIKDKEGKFLHCNKQIADFWGTTPQYMVGKSDYDFMPKKNADMYRLEEQQIINTGMPVLDKEANYSNTYKLRGWSSYTKVPFLDNEGNRAGIIGLNRDVTDSKRVTEDLRILLNIANGLQLVKSFFDIGKNIFNTLEVYGYINNYFGSLLVYDPEKKNLKSVFCRKENEDSYFFADGTEVDSPDPFLKIAFEEGKILTIKDNHSEFALGIHPAQINTKRKSMVFIPLQLDETRLGLLYFASYPENTIDDYSTDLLDSIARYAVVSISSLSSKKRSEDSEKMLLENEQRYSIVTKATKDAIFDYDIKKNVLMISNAASDIFGVSNISEAINSDSWREFVLPRDQEKVASGFRHAINNNKDINLHFRILSRDEKIKHLMIKGAIIYNSNAEAVRLIGALSDITQIKESEEALQKSQKIMQQLAKHTVQLQEEEKKRIVRELHDGINQVIASVKFKIETAKEKILNSEKDFMNPLDDAIQSLEDTIIEIRNICQNLRPNILDDFGLIPAVKRFCQEFTQKTKIPIETDFDELENRLPPEIEINIYRIFQEALNNIEKHSKATLVNCFIQFFDNEINVEIKDNGVGFDPGNIPEHTPKREHYGLMNMRERVDFIGGDIAIKSKKEAGTDIQIKIPVEYNSF
jgi:PAS domain S-box-containing protein